MSKPEFDQYAKEYDKILADSMPKGMHEDDYFTEYKIALVASYLQSEKLNRVLDFGCGAGRSLPYMAEYFTGAELWGFDPSPKSLKIAAYRAPTARLFSEWDLIPENKFDLIIAANVFHHIPLEKRPQAMERCRNALTKKGQLFLFEHNPYNPATRWIFEHCPFDADAEMLNLKAAKKLAEYAKLHLLSDGYTLFFPKPLAFLRPLESFLKRVPMGAQYYVQMAK